MAAAVAAATPSASGHVISATDVSAAKARIATYGISETPVLTCSTMDAFSGHDLFFKVEAFQKTGSFKARGATNACAQMPPGQRVVTHSSGNHAQAIAFAAKATGREATIVMPNNAPMPKRMGTAGYGAEVRLCEPTAEARAAGAAEAVKEYNAHLVHPSEDPQVIAGQGTVAFELLQQVAGMAGTASTEPPLDALVVPVGGGGMISGCAVYAKSVWPSMLIVGAEPAAMDDAFRSKASGELVKNVKGSTSVADGLKTNLGPNTWPVVRDLVDTIITVPEEDILSSTKLVWSRMKVQIEPSAGTGVAVALGEEFRALMGASAAAKQGRKARVGVILCGGNADAVALAPLLAAVPDTPAGAIVAT